MLSRHAKFECHAVFAIVWQLGFPHPPIRRRLEEIGQPIRDGFAGFWKGTSTSGQHKWRLFGLLYVCRLAKGSRTIVQLRTTPTNPRYLFVEVRVSAVRTDEA